MLRKLKVLNPLTDTGSYMPHNCKLLWHYDVITTFLNFIIFPSLPTIMELFQLLFINQNLLILKGLNKELLVALSNKL